MLTIKFSEPVDWPSYLIKEALGLDKRDLPDVIEEFDEFEDLNLVSKSSSEGMISDDHAERRNLADVFWKETDYMLNPNTGQAFEKYLINDTAVF
jgi:hypothetical protein